MTRSKYTFGKNVLPRSYFCPMFSEFQLPLTMRFFHLPLLAAIFLFACKDKPKTAEEVRTTVQLPQDFLDFYNKFHQDSQYQVEHIVWPLQGDTDEQVDSTHYQKKTTEWQQANWRMQRMNFDQSDYVIERQMLGDILIIERIRARSANFGIERRFAKQSDGQWNLIYYSDLQELRR